LCVFVCVCVRLCVFVCVCVCLCVSDLTKQNLDSRILIQILRLTPLALISMFIHYRQKNT